MAQFPSTVESPPTPSLEDLRAPSKLPRILASERRDASLRAPIVLVSDNPDMAGDFDANAEKFAATVLASKAPRNISLVELGTEPARQAIIDSFDDGASVVSYIGHGAIHIWANENLLDLSSVGSLSLQPQQPLVLTMNCLNGYFHFPYFNSLSEELVKAETKGAIAAFSPSGMSTGKPLQIGRF